MTVSSTVRTAGPFVGTGLVSDYPFSYKVFADTDVVAQTTAVDGTLTTLTLDSDYTVALNADQNASPGGTISLTVPLATGVSLELGSNLPLTQPTQITNAGGFLPKILEDAFDRCVIMIQQALTFIGGAIRVPEIGGVPAVPPIAIRKNTLFSWDSNGNPSSVVPADQSASTLAIALANAGGSNQVGFNYAQTYIQGTVGAALQDEQVNALWFITGTNAAARRTAIKARTFANDETVAAQAALDWCGPGRTVRFPGGWKINGTLTGYAGQIIIGDGWSTTTNAFTVASGSELRQYSTSDIPLLQIVGADNNNQKERWAVNDIALTCGTPGATFGTGFYAAYARQGRMKNVYIASFNTSKKFDPQCWQMKLDGVRCMDFSVGMINNSTSEDNCFIGCQWAGYRTGAVGVSLANQSANNVFINCYLQALQNGCLMAQGDTHGDGTGTPFPMFSTWISPLIEDITQFAFGLVTSAQSAVSGLHPGIRVINPRVLNTGLSGYLCSNTPSTSASGNGATATIGFAAQPVAPLVGTVTTVTGMTPSGYNGSWVITASSTTSVSFANTTTGAQTVAGTVIYGTTTFNAAPNNGQSIIYATHCSEIVLEQPMEGGFSFGVNAGVNGYGYFPTGTAPGPISLRDLNGYTFGTAATNGKTGSVSISPGDTPNARFNTTGTTLAVAAQFANPAWDQAVSNFWGWADTTMSRFTPSRAQTVRFTCNIQLANTVSGTTYALQMNKSGSTGLGIRGETTANGTGPITLFGQWYDIPNGSTDFYKVQVFVSTGASITITPASCDFNAELVGS